jgi:hypothetical protein
LSIFLRCKNRYVRSEIRSVELLVENPDNIADQLPLIPGRHEPVNYYGPLRHKQGRLSRKVQLFCRFYGRRRRCVPANVLADLRRRAICRVKTIRQRRIVDLAVTIQIVDVSRDLLCRQTCSEPN